MRANATNQKGQSGGLIAAPSQTTKQLKPTYNALDLTQDHWMRLEVIARRAFVSGLLPSSIKNQETAFIIALKGASLGFDPLYALEKFAIINGKLTIDGSSMLAMIMKSGMVKVVPKSGTMQNLWAECHMKRHSGDLEYTARWTMDMVPADLKAKDNWKKYPLAMLRWRCVSEAARIVAPDIIGGMYLHEEMGVTVDEEGRMVAEVTTPTRELKQVSATVTTTTAPSESKKEPELHSLRVALFRKGKECGYTTDEIAALIKKEFKVEGTDFMDQLQLQTAMEIMRTNPRKKEQPAQTEEPKQPEAPSDQMDEYPFDVKKEVVG